MMTRTLIAAAGLIGAVLASGSPAAAASFDCAQARAADERAICAARTLNDRDVRMALLYDIVPRLVPMGTRDAVRDAQATWLSERRRCGGNVGCLTRSYDRRIAELRAVIDRRVVPNGPF